MSRILNYVSCNCGERQNGLFGNELSFEKEVVMIESINIKNIATFNAEGVEINGLKKVNFIYGANASGKTTISNYLQNPNNEKYQGKDCCVKWKNDLKLNVLTYNKDFRERNFGKGKIVGVFTLGQAAKEQKEEIDNKMEQLNKLKEDGTKKKETLDKQIQEKQTLEDTFKETYWTKIYKKYENVFKEAFRGYLQKESFKTQLLQEFATNTTAIVSYEKLTEKAKIIFGEQPPRIDPIHDITFDRILEIENNAVWNKIIVGKADVDIAKLINKLSINDWVNQGRNYLQKNNNICPFCQQQTITDDFRKQIELLFDETYLKELKTLKDLKLEYETLTRNIINELNTIEENQKNFKKTKLDIDKFSSYLKTLISQIATNKEYLNSKEKEPSRQFTLTSLKEQIELIASLINTANLEIKKHNNIVDNFNTEKSDLIKSIWKYIAEEFKTDIAEFNKNKNGLEIGITKLNGELETKRKEYNDLNAEIKTLNKNVTSIQPTIDEINRLLKSFGFLKLFLHKRADFIKFKEKTGLSLKVH